MAESRADEIIRRQDQLRSARSNWESLWQEVADRVWPQMSDFLSKREPGAKRTEKIFDSTACLALEKFAAALHSLITPDNQQFHGLVPADKELREYHPLKQYLEDVTEILFAVRRSPFANFSSQASECYKSLGAFGTLGMMVEDIPGRGIRYKSCHLAELYISENEHGIIDTVHRRFEYTARQAASAFGMERLPDKIKAALERKDEGSKFEFIHAVEPNREQKRGRLDHEGMAFKSCYVSVEGKQLMEEGGYRTFPYAVSRYSTNPKEVYGRGPAMMVLPDIKMLNEMEKTTLRAGHMAARAHLRRRRWRGAANGAAAQDRREPTLADRNERWQAQADQRGVPGHAVPDTRRDAANHRHRGDAAGAGEGATARPDHGPPAV